MSDSSVPPTPPPTAPKSLGARARDFVEQVVGIQETPHQIALGAAIGIFVGFLPLMGVQMGVSVPLAWALRGNKMLAAAGVWITNPVTFIPFYYTCYLAGLVFYAPEVPLSFASFGAALAAADMSTLAALGAALVLPLTLGSVILGVPAAILTYALLYVYLVKRRGPAPVTPAGA